jgi:hypothetical protein
MEFDALHRRLKASEITIKLMEIWCRVQIIPGKQFNGYLTKPAHLYYS